AAVRLAGGYASDRWGRPRDVAAVGYAMSVLARLGLVLGAVPGGPSAGGLVSGSLATDRIGKGIRTAPRDAMLAATARPADLGLVFGVHRAMDTGGALLGPFAAFALLAAFPQAYDLVFVVSAAVAVVAFAALVLLVDADTGTPLPRPRRPDRPTPRAALTPLRDRRFAALVAAGFVLSLAMVGDGFVYLRLRDTSALATTYFPLLAAGTAAVYLLLAVPVGRLADRAGRGRVLLAGYGCLLGVYLLLLVPRSGTVGIVCALALLGAFYAATDGVLAAAASALLAPVTRTSGLALLATAAAIGQLLASAGFGLLWTIGGAATALRVTVGTGVVALVVAIPLLRFAEQVDHRLARRSPDRPGAGG
ncbi:MAG: MFS transporter, partial [Frankia sp.]